MKTVGKRMAHLRKSVLKITVERMKEITGVSRTPIAQIENEQEAPRALEQIIQALQLNPEWVHNGKGGIFISGTDEENIARIKAGNKSTPAESESFIEIKKELERYRDREDRLQRIIDKLIGGNNSFRKALGNASYRQTA